MRKVSINDTIKYVNKASVMDEIHSFRMITDERSEWGRLYLPATSRPLGSGMRIALFGSTTAGLLVIENLLHFDAMFPEQLDIMAIATDDTLDPRAKIGIRKRIWKYYSPGEQELLMHRMIAGACHNGIPCYTGAVKNDYFRTLLRAWNPEAIIMCCFGQKVDQYIFEYPVLGMYNFHPSDLASNIGAGAKPFESTIQQGRTTSHMILHRVTETIDAGPIVGISPKINIALQNGKYPRNFLVLQEKIPSVCGWMTYGLIMALMEKKKQGGKGPVVHIDFDRLIPEPIKTMLMKPVVDDPLKINKLPMPE